MARRWDKPARAQGLCLLRFEGTQPPIFHYFGIIYFLAVTKLHLDRTYL